MAENLLEVRNISVTFKTRYGILKALDNLSLNVKKGEILGLVGESGAGKSMTGAAILGLIDAPGQLSSGEIFYKDECISDAPEAVRGHEISMIFQDPLMSLNPLRKIGDQLVETILTHMNISKSEAIKKAKNGLKEVGIDPSRLNSYPHTFSGGMRQRVVIALALAPEPSLIIADEPTTALDVTVQAQIFDLLNDLRKQTGTAIILITHDMGAVAEMAERMIVMYAGRKVEEGPVQQVIDNAGHPYTQGLISCVPHILEKLTTERQTLQEVPGIVPSLRDFGKDQCLFATRCKYVSEKCNNVRPTEIEFESSQTVACWHTERKQ